MPNSLHKMEEPEMADDTVALTDIPALADIPVLEFRGVSKSYGTGTQRTVVLDNINLSIREGEFVAIVGFSGDAEIGFACHS